MMPVMEGLTKEEWMCYLDTPQAVVYDVNYRTIRILDGALSPKDALERMYKMLNGYTVYGFRDTECENVAVDVINKYFEHEDDVDRWSVGFI